MTDHPSPPRYASEREFPSYAYVPGRNPHPTQDPAGHSHGHEPEEPAAYFEAERWCENSDYLFGVDLYNHGYLWEAHEAWEGIWHSARADELQAGFLQGLIQCTAAALKLTMEQHRGLQRLSAMGVEKLDLVARLAGPHFMGLAVDEFATAFRSFADDEAADADARPRIVLAD